MHGSQCAALDLREALARGRELSPVRFLQVFISSHFGPLVDREVH